MRKAFTLIELLVVVAIIALLISILLPSLSRARKQARQTQCGTNERNLGTAALQYAQENRDYWHAVWDNDALRFVPLFAGKNYVLQPFVYDASGKPQATKAYWAALYDTYLGVSIGPADYMPSVGIGDRTYLGGWENTRCPEAEYTLPAFRNNGALSHDPYTLYSSYCLNGVTPGFDSIPDTGTPAFFERKNGERVPRRITQIKDPARIVFFHDGSEVVMDGNGDTLLQLDQWTGKLIGDENEQWIREYFRHPGGCMVAWADGHVAVVSKARAQKAREDLIKELGKTSGVPLLWYSTPY